MEARLVSPEPGLVAASEAIRESQLELERLGAVETVDEAIRGTGR